MAMQKSSAVAEENATANTNLSSPTVIKSTNSTKNLWCSPTLLGVLVVCLLLICGVAWTLKAQPKVRADSSGEAHRVVEAQFQSNPGKKATARSRRIPFSRKTPPATTPGPSQEPLPPPPLVEENQTPSSTAAAGAVVAPETEAAMPSHSSLPQFMWRIANPSMKPGTNPDHCDVGGWGTAAMMTPSVSETTGVVLRQPVQKQERAPWQRLLDDAKEELNVKNAGLTDGFSKNLVVMFHPPRGAYDYKSWAEVKQAILESIPKAENAMANPSVDVVELSFSASVSDNTATKLLACNDLPSATSLSDTHLCAAQVIALLGGANQWDRVWIVAHYHNQELKTQLLPALSNMSRTVQLARAAADAPPVSKTVAFWRGEGRYQESPREGDSWVETPGSTTCPLNAFLRSSCHDVDCNDKSTATRFIVNSGTSASTQQVENVFRKHMWATTVKRFVRKDTNFRSAPPSPPPYILTIPKPGMDVFGKLAAAAHYETLDTSRGFRGVPNDEVTHDGMVSSYAASTLGMLVAWSMGTGDDASQSAVYIAPKEGLGLTLGKEKTAVAAEEFCVAAAKQWSSGEAMSSGAVSNGKCLTTQMKAKKLGTSVVNNKFMDAKDLFDVPSFFKAIGAVDSEPEKQPMSEENKKKQESMRHGVPRHLDGQLCGGVTIVISMRIPDTTSRPKYLSFLNTLATYVRRVIVLSHWRNAYNHGFWPVPAVCTDNHATAACFAWLNRLQAVKDSCGVVFLHADAFVDLSRFFATTGRGGLMYDGSDDERGPMNIDQVGVTDPNDYSGNDVTEFHKFAISAKEPLAMRLHPDEWAPWRSPMHFSHLGMRFPQMFMDAWTVMNDIAVSTFPQLKRHPHVSNTRYTSFTDLFYVPTSTLPLAKSAIPRPPLINALDAIQDVLERTVMPVVLPAEACMTQVAKYVSSLLGTEYISPKPVVHGANTPPRTFSKSAVEATHSYWGSTIMRGYSLLGHCCAWMDSNALNSWQHVGIHKIPLQQPIVSVKMEGRTQQAFTCTKRAVRLDLLSNEQLTWLSSRGEGGIPSYATSSRTLLASSSTSCKVQLLHSAANGAIRYHKKLDDTLSWGTPSASEDEAARFSNNMYIAQFPISTDLVVDVPMFGTTMQNPTRPTTLYVIAPSALRVEVRLPTTFITAMRAASQGKTQEGQLGNIVIYAVTGAMTPFSVSTTKADGTSSAVNGGGSRDQDLLRVTCSSDAVLKGVAISNDDKAASHTLFTMHSNLSPYVEVRRKFVRNAANGAGPHVDVEFAAQKTADGCTVTVLPRENLLPVWGEP